MLFRQIDEILSGRKTQTRRVVKPDELPWANGFDENGDPFDITDVKIMRPRADGEEVPLRVKWAVGRTYAVCPGRGKPSVARIRLLEIRRERLQDISLDDVAAEGIGRYTFARGCLRDPRPDPRWKYIELWDSINDRPGLRWENNPEVWVLRFELAQSGAYAPSA